MAQSILIVDDSPEIRELLDYNLKQEGYTVLEASNGEEAYLKAKEHKPDLVLLDIMMPGVDGVEACRRIRQDPDTADIYVIFLTARAEEYSEVAAFDVGADDYINKPIKPRALISRIASALKRSTKKKQGVKINIGDLSIDRTSYSVTKNGKKIVFPKKEFELLSFLASNPDQVFSRDELLSSIWGNDVYVLARTVDVHVRKVREKIGKDNIKTIKGVGYKFITEETEAI